MEARYRSQRLLRAVRQARKRPSGRHYLLNHGLRLCNFADEQIVLSFEIRHRSFEMRRLIVEASSVPPPFVFRGLFGSKKWVEIRVLFAPVLVDQITTALLVGEEIRIHVTYTLNTYEHKPNHQLVLPVRPCIQNYWELSVRSPRNGAVGASERCQ